MIKRKQVDTKSITLQEITSKLYFGDEEIAIFGSSEGFGILTLLNDFSEMFLFLTDEGAFLLHNDDLEDSLSRWKFVEYKAFKNLDISF